MNRQGVRADPRGERVETGPAERDVPRRARHDGHGEGALSTERFARTDDEAEEPARGGSWLTYRYRLGGGDAVAASGTIKAPSFLSAARRLVARRLAERLGSSPAYLRLRAAGEEEVLLRVTPASGGGGAAAGIEVVPRDAYAFEGADPDAT